MEAAATSRPDERVEWSVARMQPMGRMGRVGPARWTLAVVALAGLALLAGCGGGDDAGDAPVSARAVVDAFRAAGLEAEDARPMTNDEYGLAPKRADDALRFFIPSLGPDSGGRVLVYRDRADLEAMKAYYAELSETPAFFSWVYQEGDVLVQINGRLPEEQARRYAATLAEVAGD